MSSASFLNVLAGLFIFNFYYILFSAIHTRTHSPQARTYIHTHARIRTHGEEGQDSHARTHTRSLISITSPLYIFSLPLTLTLISTRKGWRQFFLPFPPLFTSSFPFLYIFSALTPSSLSLLNFPQVKIPFSLMACFSAITLVFPPRSPYHINRAQRGSQEGFRGS